MNLPPRRSVIRTHWETQRTKRHCYYPLSSSPDKLKMAGAKEVSLIRESTERSVCQWRHMQQIPKVRSTTPCQDTYVDWSDASSTQSGEPVFGLLHDNYWSLGQWPLEINLQRGHVQRPSSCLRQTSRFLAGTLPFSRHLRSTQSVHLYAGEIMKVLSL